jgi:hypothetical protein
MLNRCMNCNFRTWLELNTIGTEDVDESQIDAVYDKAKHAVKLVRLYDSLTNQSLLKNISTIANLNSGAYGLYASSLDRKIIGPSVVNKLKMKFGNDIMDSNKINNIPNAVIKKYIPDIDINQLTPSDTIQVNVRRHVQEHGDSLEAVLEIASTIVHEATHEIERQTLGRTDETGPRQAEATFMNWVKTNWNNIITRIPELKQIPSKSTTQGF